MWARHPGLAGNDTPCTPRLLRGGSGTVPSSCMYTRKVVCVHILDVHPVGPLM